MLLWTDLLFKLSIFSTVPHCIRGWYTMLLMQYLHDYHAYPDRLGSAYILNNISMSVFVQWAVGVWGSFYIDQQVFSHCMHLTAVACWHTSHPSVAWITQPWRTGAFSAGRRTATWGSCLVPKCVTYFSSTLLLRPARNMGFLFPNPLGVSEPLDPLSSRCFLLGFFRL